MADMGEWNAAAGVLPEFLGRRYLISFDTGGCIQHSSDVLIIGSGIAGLTAALNISPGCSVTLLTKGALCETSTWHAQGGIAGAIGEADCIELHLADTVAVGDGLCDEAVVREVLREAPEVPASLSAYGMDFDTGEDGAVALAREGGHSVPRVLHSGDATGAAIQTALSSCVLASGRVEILEHRFLVDLLTVDGRCVGALVFATATAELEVFWARAVVLATGGAGQIYRVTTNPLGATGDGLAAAWRAGAKVCDLEFVQFHPTALDHDEVPRFLISEALRGEGAYLLDGEGERFMLNAHPLAELAPRDIVSREIEGVMRKEGRTSVLLDARHLDEAHLRQRFPKIWKATAEAGYELSRDLVPVAPAAHYLIGGVQADVDGRTSIPGLYASGEAAASGLHGANRLASNSLLEALVISRRIARALEPPAQGVRPRLAVKKDRPGGLGEAGALRRRLKDSMQRYAGVERCASGLAVCAQDLSYVTQAMDFETFAIRDLELKNMATVAALITHSAWTRTESRGCHFRSDYPGRDDVCWGTRGRCTISRAS